MGYFPFSKKSSPLLRSVKMDHCRLISQAPILARLMGRIVKDQLIAFLFTNQLIDEPQHGFLKLRFRTSCHFDLFDLDTLNVDKKRAAILFYRDIAKAFDRVPHERLSQNTKSHGTSYPLYFWLTSHFSDHSQVASINGTLSKPQPITSGVI